MIYYGKILSFDSTNFLKNTCFEIGEVYSFESNTISCDVDHVHFLLELSRKKFPSRVMQIIKCITAIKIFKECPEIRKQFGSGELWSDG
jgi:putative transposase